MSRPVQCDAIRWEQFFLKDVVLDSFNKAYRDENNILDQMNIIKYVRIFIMMILIPYNNMYKKMHTNTTVALKPNFMSSLLLCAVFL